MNRLVKVPAPAAEQDPNQLGISTDHERVFLTRFPAGFAHLDEGLPSLFILKSLVGGTNVTTANWCWSEDDQAWVFTSQLSVTDTVPAGEGRLSSVRTRMRYQYVQIVAATGSPTAFYYGLA